MQEENIFDHVFYEFEVYLYTYVKMITMQCIKKQEGTSFDQNDYNATWDSHFLHLRNLIGFFEADANVTKFKTDITVKTVLKYSKSSTYDFNLMLKNPNTNKDIKMWQIQKKKRKLIPLTCSIVANKTIEHLTEERYNYKRKLQDKSLTIKTIQLQVINEMIYVIVDKALLFFNELNNPKRLRKKYKEDFIKLSDRFLQLRDNYQNFKNTKRQQN